MVLTVAAKACVVIVKYAQKQTLRNGRFCQISRQSWHPGKVLSGCNAAGSRLGGGRVANQSCLAAQHELSGREFLFPSCRPGRRTRVGDAEAGVCH